MDQFDPNEYQNELQPVGAKFIRCSRCREPDCYWQNIDGKWWILKDGKPHKCNVDRMIALNRSTPQRYIYPDEEVRIINEAFKRNYHDKKF